MQEQKLKADLTISAPKKSRKMRLELQIEGNAFIINRNFYEYS